MSSFFQVFQETIIVKSVNIGRYPFMRNSRFRLNLEPPFDALDFKDTQVQSTGTAEHCRTHHTTTHREKIIPACVPSWRNFNEKEGWKLKHLVLVFQLLTINLARTTQNGCPCDRLRS